MEKQLGVLLYAALVIYQPQESFVAIYLQELHVIDVSNTPVLMIKTSQILAD
jgi:hypothetical protein